MEREELNTRINELTQVINDTYASKAKSYTWLGAILAIGFIFLFIGEAKCSCSIQCFLKNMGFNIGLILFLMTTIIKSIKLYRKISRSRDAAQVLDAFDRNVKTDKIILMVFIPVLLLLAYVCDGLGHFVGLLVLSLVMIAVIMFSSNPGNDKNIDRLRELVAEQKG